MKQLLVFLCMISLAFGIELQSADLKDLQKDTITVTIDGEVMHPGEMEVERYASLQSVIEAAEPKEDADLSVFNGQSIVNDKDVIHVPAVKEKAESRISINTADAEALCTLPGIGKSTAERIVSYRNENGLFQSLEELMEVKGIGISKFEKLKEHITL